MTWNELSIVQQALVLTGVTAATLVLINTYLVWWKQAGERGPGACDCNAISWSLYKRRVPRVNSHGQIWHFTECSAHDRLCEVCAYGPGTSVHGPAVRGGEGEDYIPLKSS